MARTAVRNLPTATATVDLYLSASLLRSLIRWINACSVSRAWEAMLSRTSPVLTDNVVTPCLLFL